MAYVLATVVMVLLNLQLLLATAVINQTAPSYSPVCPGDTVIFTCTTDTNKVIWSLDKNDGTTIIMMSFVNHTANSQQQLDQFTLTLVSITQNSTISTATVTNINNSLNSTIYCSDDENNSSMVTLIVRNITSPIGLSVTVLDNSSVKLTWSPPLNDSICITHYIVIISTRYKVSMTTYTSTLVLSHLSYGVTYNFTVAAVDKRNITGTYSENVTINLSVYYLNLGTTSSSIPSLSITLVPNTGTTSMTIPSPSKTILPSLTSNTLPITTSMMSVSSTVISIANTGAAIIAGAVGASLVLMVIAIIIIIILIGVICFGLRVKKSKTETSSSNNFNMYSTVQTIQQPNNQELTIPVYAEVNHKKVNEDNIDGFSEATRQVTNIDDVAPPIPPYNPMEFPSYSYEYSEINKQKQKHENAESPELSTSKQGGIVYAEVGDFHSKPPPAVPPPIEVQPVMYSEIIKLPINPPTSDQQIMPGQDDMETLPPPPLPKCPPKINHL